MQCIVKDCENNDSGDNGNFILIFNDNRIRPKWICRPCMSFIVNKVGTNSQIVKNCESVMEMAKNE